MRNKISKLALKIFCWEYLTLKFLFLIFLKIPMYQSIYPSLCVFMYFKNFNIPTVKSINVSELKYNNIIYLHKL